MNDLVVNNVVINNIVVKDKFTKGDKTAVLISGGFGAGWSTWTREYALFLATNYELVKMAMREASTDEVEEYLSGIFPDEHICVLGWEDVDVRWVATGSLFRIDEYDGSETLIELGYDDETYMA